MWSPDIIGKQNFKGLRTIFLLVVMRYSSHMIIFFSGYSASLNTCHASSHLILITEFQFSLTNPPPTDGTDLHNRGTQKPGQSVTIDSRLTYNPSAHIFQVSPGVSLEPLGDVCSHVTRITTGSLVLSELSSLPHKVLETQ